VIQGPERPQLRPLAFALRLIIPAFLLSSCGYIGDPLPPLANIPKQITDLDALQRGDRLIVHFTIPQRTTEDYIIRSPLRLDLRVDDRAIPEPSSANGLAEYNIPTTDWTGKTVAITARAIGSNGKPGGWSKVVNLPIVPPPERPEGVQEKATPDGVEVSWQGPPGEFSVLRRNADEKDYAPIAQVQRNQYLDRSAEFGKKYVYLVLRVVKLEGGRMAQSELSAEVQSAPRDIFPPAAPAGLLAVAAPKSIELTWDRNAEADVAGYRVYRSVGDGAFEKLADVSQIPTYSDHAVEAGKSYRYQVSAVDQAGNESPRSAVVVVAVD
jgi:hypothetical protein